MKIVFISDVHGVPSTLEAALGEAGKLGYDRLVLLGDLLYHGPRNGVPNFYDPVKVAALLNPLADRIVAVRGNCDAEVDQMMLEFPMMGDYAVLDAGKEQFFLTHGHLWNEDRLPPLGMGSVLAHGHTHIPELKKLACGLTIFNPGSISLPKGGFGRTFGYFDGETLRHLPVPTSIHFVKKLACVALAVLALGAIAEADAAEGLSAVTNVASAVQVPHPQPPRIESRAFELVYASAKEVADVINMTWRGNASPAWGVTQVAVPMPDVNTVVVTAPLPILDSCEKLIPKLDKKQKQVYVEARFVYLKNNAARDLGIHWGILHNVGIESAQATLTYNRRSGSDKEVSTLTKFGDSTTKTTSVDQNENAVFSGVLTSTALSFFLSALEASADVRTFQNPKVIVTSGREARVDMTTKRPNVIVSAKRVVNGSNNTLDADMRMAEIPGKDSLMFAGESFFSWGVELSVIPRVQTNGLINVKIVPTISECTDYVKVQSGNDSEVPYAQFPIIDMRRIVSEFSMKSGMTAVIGGLSFTTEEDGDSGIPWLQNIPWIGNKLFGYRSREKVQQEIMVFVTVGFADPEDMPVDVGVPKNAVIGRQYTDGKLKEPGDRTDAVKGLQSLDFRDLDDRD